MYVYFELYPSGVGYMYMICIHSAGILKNNKKIIKLKLQHDMYIIHCGVYLKYLLPNVVQVMYYMCGTYMCTVYMCATCHII